MAFSTSGWMVMAGLEQYGKYKAKIDYNLLKEGISQAQVSRLEKNALKTMRSYLA